MREIKTRGCKRVFQRAREKHKVRDIETNRWKNSNQAGKHTDRQTHRQIERGKLT